MVKQDVRDYDGDEISFGNCVLSWPYDCNDFILVVTSENMFGLPTEELLEFHHD